MVERNFFTDPTADWCDRHETSFALGERCPKCPSLDDPRFLRDGFGSVWEKCGHLECDLQIVRPGKVQCSGFCQGATFSGEVKP
jgi:hypothetical protein